MERIIKKFVPFVSAVNFCAPFVLKPITNDTNTSNYTNRAEESMPHLNGTNNKKFVPFVSAVNFCAPFVLFVLKPITNDTNTSNYTNRAEESMLHLNGTNNKKIRAIRERSELLRPIRVIRVKANHE